MSHFVIRIRFIAHSYSGIRIRGDRQEELDWPPSPGRLHEALLSAALLGVQRSDSDRGNVFKAFRWLEELPEPEIWASAQDESLRTAPRLAIPQNNPKKIRYDIKPTLLAPTRKAVSVNGGPLDVIYRWPLGDDVVPESHLDIITDAAARMSYLGRAEDRAEVILAIGCDPEQQPLVRWQPDPGGHAELWVPKAGTTDGLEERHTSKVNERETRKPAQRWMRLVRYSDDSPRAMQPVATAIFQLMPADGDPDANVLSCDAEYSGLWREFFRREILNLANDPDNWDELALAEELLTGHSSPGKRATRPHLAIVPLPSVDAARKADGRVRRVALLGYAAPEVAAKALSIYDTLFKALDDLIVIKQTPFRRQDEHVPVRLKLRDPSDDVIWHHLTSRSRVWCSVVPAAISRGFKVPNFHPDGRPMSDNERHRRKLHEWSELLRASLHHVGLPPEITAACAIETTATPLVPKSQRAEKYRAPGEKAVLTHVRLGFPAQVRGPLILGDRRYFGLGLFVPLTS
ncbi:MAG: type I-U CRISPR-associated protein Csb2 [Verrucomicrobiales bacterium]|nr:type I-U CRISPR-associated protein Csb2 [Verrucomicrobiales bacterium]